MHEFLKIYARILKIFLKLYFNNDDNPIYENPIYEKNSKIFCMIINNKTHFFITVHTNFITISYIAELYLQSEVAEIHHSITPLAFYREYVSKNVPLVIRGAIKHWPAVGKWSIPYFYKMLGEEKVLVAVTPNGYADAIVKQDDKEFFVMPEERLLTISTFLDTLENTKEDSVFYIQQQNSNFIHSFRKLWPDTETEISWASEAFGKQPDAVNFWMGDERAVTSSKVLFYLVTQTWKYISIARI